MKKYLNIITALSVLMAFLIANPAKAQMDDEAGVGIKGGLNFTNLFIDDIDDENIGIGFQVGIVGKLPLTEVFAIQPELLYTQKGATAVFDAVDQEVAFNLNYIQLPLLMNFNLGDVFNIHAGPYAAYLLNANVDFDLDKDNFNTFDAGLSVGFEVGVRNLSVGARYDYGLIGVGNEGFVNELTGLEDAKNNAIQLYVVLGL